MFSNIKKCLSGLDKRIVESMSSGCDSRQFYLLEELVGDFLPQDYKNMYLEFNGNSRQPGDLSLLNFAYGMCFYSIKECMEDLTSQMSVAAPVYPLKHASEEINKACTFDSSRIPLAHDYGSSFICVDLSPSKVGEIGQVIFVYYEYSISFFIAASLTAMLEDFIEDLTAGKYSLDEYALSENEFWLKPDSSISLKNWIDPNNRWRKKYPDFCELAPYL